MSSKKLEIKTKNKTFLVKTIEKVIDINDRIDNAIDMLMKLKITDDVIIYINDKWINFQILSNNEKLDKLTKGKSFNFRIANIKSGRHDNVNTSIMLFENFK